MENSLTTQPNNAVAAWPPELVFDIAIEAFTLPELLDRYNATEYELQSLYNNTQFRRELIQARADLLESGGKFRAKARVQAEAYLEHMHNIMIDPTVADSVKVTIWKSMAEYAELGPRKASVDGGDSASPFNVQINIGKS